MSLLERLPSALATFAAFAVLSGCATYRPPFTRTAGAAAQADPRQATVVFLWPSTSCDPAGYFTLATADGTFLGNITRGSRLSVPVRAGESTVVAWDEAIESATGWTRKEIVPVLHMDLREGRTYYVRMLLGEWNAVGPAEVIAFSTRGRYGSRRCVGIPETTTSAMAVLSPAVKEWQQLPAWMTELDAIVPDRAAGQAWLDGNHASLEAHVAVAQERFAELRPVAKRLASVEPADGAPR